MTRDGRWQAIRWLTKSLRQFNPQGRTLFMAGGEAGGGSPKNNLKPLLRPYLRLIWAPSPSPPSPPAPISCSPGLRLFGSLRLRLFRGCQDLLPLQENTIGCRLTLGNSRCLQVKLAPSASLANYFPRNRLHIVSQTPRARKAKVAPKNTTTFMKGLATGNTHNI